MLPERSTKSPHSTLNVATRMTQHLHTPSRPPLPFTPDAPYEDATGSTYHRFRPSSHRMTKPSTARRGHRRSLHQVAPRHLIKHDAMSPSSSSLSSS
uniref:Uncharacterized protein n=1 Tax=Arundo donax TaxID=35708 RepID=A0A0A9DIG4_ARUDO